MGVGLYYANLVMELNMGSMLILEPGEASIPNGFDGAALALVFPQRQLERMESSSTIVAIDDRREHVRAITDALALEGLACLGLHYVAETGIPVEYVRHVRVLFLDLHLNDSIVSTDEKRHFGTLVALLEDAVRVDNGPFVLALWTEYPDQAVRLADYIDSAICDENRHIRPVLTTRLSKRDYIDTQSGEIKEPGRLRAEVREVMRGSAPLAALLEWEHSINAAAARTLASMLNAVGVGELPRDLSEYLDQRLSHLAVSAIGRDNVAGNERFAVAQAFGPLLSDELQAGFSSQADSADLWASALSYHGARTRGMAGATAAAELNFRVHFSPLTPGASQYDQLGVVRQLPGFIWSSDAWLRGLFGVSKAELLAEFSVPPGIEGHCRPVAMRIGAACDFAQGKLELPQYALGLELPTGKKSGKLGDALIESPPFLRQGSDRGPLAIRLHARFLFSQPRTGLESWPPLYRAREQLFDVLVRHFSNYRSRLGLLVF